MQKRPTGSFAFSTVLCTKISDFNQIFSNNLKFLKVIVRYYTIINCAFHKPKSTLTNAMTLKLRYLILVEEKDTKMITDRICGD